MLPSVLVIEDEATLAKNIRAYLNRQGFDVRVAANGGRGLTEFERFAPDVVLLDYNLPDVDGLQVFERLKSIDPSVDVVMITGEGGVSVAVAAMKAGVRDYLTKPLALGELGILLQRIAGEERMQGMLRYYQGREPGGAGMNALLGESGAMRALKGQLRQILDSDARVSEGPLAAVLIMGETGTGKELVARTLHFDGPRRAQAFIEFNCAAIPTSLLESELFGYEKGAFTDARERKRGLIETAQGGTLFLDEIGDMDPAAQSKLLKVLEDRNFRRLGGLRDIPSDVRVVSASNQPLEQMVARGEFRSDLYYRLRVVELKVPPLREREDDVLLLADEFLHELSRRYRKPNLRFSEGAREVMLRHAWPGNVRELRNVVEHVVLLAKGPLVEASELGLISAPEAGHAGDAPAAGVTLPPEGLDLQEVERMLVAQALERTGGNVTGAAKLLGLSRDTLRYRMEKHALKPEG